MTFFPGTLPAKPSQSPLEYTSEFKYMIIPSHKHVKVGYINLKKAILNLNTPEHSPSSAWCCMSQPTSHIQTHNRIKVGQTRHSIELHTAMFPATPLLPLLTSQPVRVPLSETNEMTSVFTSPSDLAQRNVVN